MARREERVMGKKYEAFLADPESIPEGVEIRLFIKDLTPGPQKYDARFVKAVVSSSPEHLPGSAMLRLRSLDGKPHPKTLAIRVVEDLGEFVSAPPYGVHTGLFPEDQPGQE
jgi:hypothetical protein